MNTKKILTAFLIASSFLTFAQQKGKSAQLPKEANTFLEANFKGVEIQNVKKEKEGTTFKYEVKLVNGAAIEFNNRGRWQELESNAASLPTTMLHSSVASYIQKNYAGATVTEVKKGIRFNFVEINNSETLQFDSEGKFIKLLVE
jgi:hypothetical protein